MENKKRTVLIAEDEEDLREMYTQALSGQGFEVLQAINGNEAIEWLERRGKEIDMVLLDIVMPALDGLETLEKIKKNESLKNIPIIVFTNLNNEEDKQQAFALGANGYFVKSQHTPAELVAKIKQFFSEKESGTGKKIV
ncbi:MAG TPA: response regulator [Candidatus Moranbacteria bacterium]|jgi:CheY-like chemotaxis protein|nr:response regulator [Candidatus Moranbacteria bacterium]HOF42315.1 response regulator [Candidatus Moranbacteria bacterium]HPX94266.1 response regulator [Candidatus Moranbacteria bacterium]HQB59717.1 response regulator [Candidatus Moranbacteria bacterium]